MILESADSIQQFITLGTKSEVELKAICEGYGLSINGSKNDLINRLIGSFTEQTNVLSSQAISLKTTDSNGNLIPKRIETIKRWRKILFNRRSVKKEFKLIGPNGDTYIKKLSFLACPQQTLQVIIREKWCEGYYTHQRDLLNALERNPDAFNTHIISKPTSDGSYFVMLHCEVKN